MKKYQNFGTERASLARGPNGSVGLNLSDKDGRTRLRLTVDGNGTPSFDMLDAEGRIIRHIDPTTPEPNK